MTVAEERKLTMKNSGLRPDNLNKATNNIGDTKCQTPPKATSSLSSFLK
jgi:hypothetical protein